MQSLISRVCRQQTQCSIFPHSNCVSLDTISSVHPFHIPMESKCQLSIVIQAAKKLSHVCDCAENVYNINKYQAFCAAEADPTSNKLFKVCQIEK